MATYLRRSLEPVIRKAAAEFPAIVLTGPRQSGKTTLLRQVFGETHGYVALDLPDVRASVASDPRGFLDAHESPVIFDELQYVPELLPYIKERIDARRDVPGQYLLTGSQNLLLLQGVTESLAGRAAMLRLLPLSRREAAGRPDSPLPWEGGGADNVPTFSSPTELWADILRGGFPELAAAPDRDASLWHASYVESYLERDVRSLRQVGDLTQFQSFLRALAARSAQLLNLTDLARDVGVAVNTAKSWLSVLEAGYQVFVLRPYFANVGKRMVKSPKVYFADTGTLCYLTGLQSPEHAVAGPMGGALMETAVISEVLRTLTHRGTEPQLYFWRTSTGTEVDLVVKSGTELVPVEIKISATPRPAMAESISAFRADVKESTAGGYVVHPGTVRTPLGSDAVSLPFAEL